MPRFAWIIRHTTSNGSVSRHEACMEFDLLETADARDIGQCGRSDKTQVEHQSQGLAAGQHPGIEPGRGESSQRGLNIAGCVRIERHRPQGNFAGARLSLTSARATSTGCGRDLGRCRASMIRRGVAGVELISAPSGASASLIAFMIVLAEPMAAPSPTPLMPRAVFGEGVSVWKMRIGGTSVAPGSR